MLLPCDDPDWSNFTKFFALNFKTLGLKKLISTSYAPNSNVAVSNFSPTLFELESPDYDETKSAERGRLFTLEGRDANGDGVINIEDLQWEYLHGDGDFRSAEVTALRDEADFVITNPPFSLFKEFIPWLAAGGVRFSVIGNMNAITYKEVFVLIRANQLWLGPTINSGDREFRVPENYPLTAVGQRVDEAGQKFVRVKGVRWFTNIEHGRRHEPLQLMTMADNLKFSNNKVIQSIGYPEYVNFGAIDVPAALTTPSDYDGIMGVPITFLDKYNPDQFEIIGNSDDMDMTREIGVRPLGRDFIQAYRGRGGTGHYSPGMRMLGVMEPEPRTVYKRILIRRKDA